MPNRLTALLAASTASVMIAAQPAPASSFQQITSASEFEQVVIGHQLSRFGIRLQVTEDGEINGRAFGYSVTGDWQWRDGFFCRIMDWGGTEIPYNCQMVLRSDNSVRFVSDQGTGDSADFRLR